MSFGLYAIRDVKTSFLSPAIDVNDQAAVRNFYHTVQNSEGVMYSCPQDFSLYRVGEFDADSGLLIPASPIVYLASASDAIAALDAERGVSHA